MNFEIRQGDALELLREIPEGTVQCVVTSPPYWGLRDYGVAGQIGLETTPEEYVAAMVDVFREVRRVLREDGTLWLNLGDSYSGSGKGGNPDAGKQATNKGSQSIGVLYGKAGETAREAAVTNVTRNWDGLPPKQLIGVPWRVAFALQADGWWLRADNIWAKPNPMPESVRDRTTRSHEYLFHLAKSERYYYDADAIAEPGVWPGQNRNDTQPIERTMPGAPPHRGLRAKDVRDKQRGHGRRHAGFNERWDAMEKAEQCAGPRNKRSVWTISPQPFPDAHFAVMPQDLVEPCVLAGSRAGDLVMDPFAGSGTVGVVALRHGRRFLGLELNPAYVAMAKRRVAGPLFAVGAS